MFLSIIVPVYNAEKYLDECIESVLHQSEQDFEIVLVNDGSTDASGQICDRYHAAFPDKIRVIHQENQGSLTARLTGVHAAQGEYCMFLDSDDSYEPECLSTVRETVAQTGADIVIFNNYSYFEADGSIEPNRAAFPDGTVFSGDTKRLAYEELISSERLNNLCMKAIKTSLLHADDTEYACFADNPYCEDLLQSLYSVTHAERIVYRDKVLYRYRRHAASVTRQIDFQRLERMFGGNKINELRRYVTIWGMDTPQHMQKLQARTTRSALTIFWLHYRAAKTMDQKRALLNFPWDTKFNAQQTRLFENPYLSRMHRFQVRAIIKKEMLVLDGICMLGKIKMRARHEAGKPAGVHRL